MRAPGSYGDFAGTEGGKLLFDVTGLALRTGWSLFSKSFVQVAECFSAVLTEVFVDWHGDFSQGV